MMHDLPLYESIILLALSGTLKTLTTQVAAKFPERIPAIGLLIVNYAGQVLFKYVRLTSRQPSLNSTAAAIATPASLLRTSRTRHMLLLMSVLDVVGCALCLEGASLCGAGLYQVLNSSILVMIAVLSRVVLGYRQTRAQWACLLMVTFGLCASALAATKHKDEIALENRLHSNHPVPSSPFSTHWVGTALTLLGTLLYALQSVLCELLHVRSHQTTNPTLDKVTSAELNEFIGHYGLLASIAYYLCTIINWNYLDVSLVLRAVQYEWSLVDSSLVAVMLCYLISNIFHNVTYWRAVERIGPTSTGLANALRTVCVFLLSAACFCRTNQMQCLTTYKCISAFIVVAGVVLFQMCPTEHKTRSSCTDTERVKTD